MVRWIRYLPIRRECRPHVRCHRGDFGIIERTRRHTNRETYAKQDVGVASAAVSTSAVADAAMAGGVEARVRELRRRRCSIQHHRRDIVSDRRPHFEPVARSATHEPHVARARMVVEQEVARG